MDFICFQVLGPSFITCGCSLLLALLTLSAILCTELCSHFLHFVSSFEKHSDCFKDKKQNVQLRQTANNLC